MTAPDLCTLASAAFPGLTFTPVDFGGMEVSASSSRLRVIYSLVVRGFAVSVRGSGTGYLDGVSYQSGWFDDIESAHADALACRAEYEPEVAPSPTTQGLLDL